MWPNNNALEDTVEYGHCALYLHNIRRHCSYGTSPVDIGCGALRRAITRSVAQWRGATPRVVLRLAIVT